MKKVVLLALAAASICGTAAAQEVTYVEDCSQGVLMNRNADNWFLTVEGGANVWFKDDAPKMDLKDRIGPQAALYVGKWVSPVFGFRFGAQWIMPKACTANYTVGNPAEPKAIASGSFVKENQPLFTKDGQTYAMQKFMGIGPEFDVMISLTNWWCGYKPNRVYNAVLHGGAGANWTLYRGYKAGNLEWRSAHNCFLFANIGLQQNFRLSKVVELFLDLKFQCMKEGKEQGIASAALGLNFNFPKQEWSCPVTAVCPTWKYTDAEGDALVARLQGAENKIRDLQRQLDECLKRPTTAAQVVKDCEGLATIYYPINQSGLSKREKNILKGVADVMVNNPDKVYTLTGWADTYTGNDEINAKLRQARVDGVKAFLVSCGVPESQLVAEVSGNVNLTDFGAKSAALDRAVTIDVK